MFFFVFLVVVVVFFTIDKPSDSNIMFILNKLKLDFIHLEFWLF